MGVLYLVQSAGESYHRNPAPFHIAAAALYLLWLGFTVYDIVCGEIKKPNKNQIAAWSLTAFTLWVLLVVGVARQFVTPAQVAGTFVPPAPTSLTVHNGMYKGMPCKALEVTDLRGQPVASTPGDAVPDGNYEVEPWGDYVELHSDLHEIGTCDAPPKTRPSRLVSNSLPHRTNSR